MHRVLVVEDDPANLKILAEFISGMGCEPICCGDGCEAWDVLESDQDLSMVITDVIMPKMGGRELLRRIRHSKAHCNLPVLVISGVVGPMEINKLLLDGASAFLAKPVKREVVIDYVKSNLMEKKKR